MSKKSSSGKTGPVSKREAVRERRKQKQRKQRLYIVLGVIGVAIIIAAAIIIPSAIPAGDFVTITPQARPMVDGKALGDPNAPVTVEVFEDFQCPACRAFTEQIEPQIVDTYVATGEVYYIFRHFPFIDDRAPRNESDQAASASMCAADENRFWDYHDMLFANWNGENQGAFNDKRLVAFAEAIGLDMAAFNACFEANIHEEEIKSDEQMGRDSGVTGTPSVMVNGRIISPGFVPSFQQISDAIEAELANSGN
ncbi:MAG: DsbA family protein [Anaerolineales bacterium]